jgi:response regulator RpfG family c-di-GMP phosphodiesterase
MERGLSMNKILCVDDDENTLAAYQRQLRKQFQIETAPGGVPGLQMISSGEPYAVVISDLKMPGMDGVEFLSKVKQITPDTVRIMLTGHAEIQAAIEAVNQGSIFRFLTKPCSNETLVQALQAGLQQYHLVIAEKELLEQTLKGAIGVLTEIISILDTESFGRACILRDTTREIAKALKVSDTWDLELAAMFCEIGRVTIPANIIVREKTGKPLSSDERDMLMRVPEIGYKLLAKIPRLESVAQMVLYCKKNFDGSGFPKDRVAGKQIPLGSRIIKIISDLIHFESEGTEREAAFETLKYGQGFYDPEILEFASRYLASPAGSSKPTRKLIRSVSVAELEVGQMLLSDVITGSGALLIAAGNRISESLREKIRNFAKIQGIREPIKVEIIEHR